MIRGPFTVIGPRCVSGPAEGNFIWWSLWQPAEVKMVAAIRKPSVL